MITTYILQKVLHYKHWVICEHLYSYMTTKLCCEGQQYKQQITVKYARGKRAYDWSWYNHRHLRLHFPYTCKGSLLWDIPVLPLRAIYVINRESIASGRWDIKNRVAASWAGPVLFCALRKANYLLPPKKTSNLYKIVLKGQYHAHLRYASYAAVYLTEW